MNTDIKEIWKCSTFLLCFASGKLYLISIDSSEEKKTPKTFLKCIFISKQKFHPFMTWLRNTYLQRLYSYWHKYILVFLHRVLLSGIDIKAASTLFRPSARPPPSNTEHNCLIQFYIFIFCWNEISVPSSFRATERTESMILCWFVIFRRFWNKKQFFLSWN